MKIGKKAILGNFGQVWTSLDKFGQVWTSLGQVWASLGEFGQVWASQDKATNQKNGKKGTKILVVSEKEKVRSKDKEKQG